jgi:uncharacterized protein YbaP (TraB family)
MPSWRRKTPGALPNDSTPRRIPPAHSPRTPALAESYLWEVSSLTNRLYLFGTIHAGKHDWYPLPTAVEEAFVDAKLLVVEADIADAAKLMKSRPR